jgi:DNA recombination protein RmuC
MDASALTLLLVAALALLAGLALGWLAARNAATRRLDTVPDQLSAALRAQQEALAPVRDTLERVEGQVRAAERSSQDAYSRLLFQAELTQRSAEDLRQQTAALAGALRAPKARGRWGELQLRRVVELAGMTEHVSFSEQPTVTVAGQDLRPDLLVHLPGEKHVVVDAKVPLDAYLRAHEATSDVERDRAFADHAKAVRAHIRSLGGKAYWRGLDRAPDFVVLFVPGEAFLAAAFEADPDLVEEGVRYRVVLATPQTLIATLYAVSYAWQQDALADHAREVFTVGRELTERLTTFATHLGGVGKALSGAVTAYNKAVGSLDSRVLVTARRLEDYGVGGAIPAPPTVDDATRVPAALRLVAGAADEAPTGTS